jgi:hypothetical protein
MTDKQILTTAQAVLDAIKPRWRQIDKANKAALLKEVKAAIKASMPKDEADEVQS